MVYDRVGLLSLLKTLVGKKTEAEVAIKEYAWALEQSAPATTTRSRDAWKRVARANLGYATGDGLELSARRWWATLGVRHPALPELAERDMDPREIFQVGLRLGSESSKEE